MTIITDPKLFQEIINRACTSQNTELTLKDCKKLLKFAKKEWNVRKTLIRNQPYYYSEALETQKKERRRKHD